MLLAYMDEAYDADRYRITALLVEHQRVNELHLQLREVVNGAIKDFGVAIDAELHGWEIYKGRGGWAEMGAAHRARIAAYRRAFEVLAAGECQIVVCGQNRRSEPGRHNWPSTEHRLVVMDAIAHLHAVCVERDDHVLVVADEHEAQDGMNVDVRSFQDSTPDCRVVDTVHFVRSCTSPLVQAADLVCYLVRRAEAEQDERSRTVNAKLLELIEPCRLITDVRTIGR